MAGELINQVSEAGKPNMPQLRPCSCLGTKIIPATVQRLLATARQLSRTTCPLRQQAQPDKAAGPTKPRSTAPHRPAQSRSVVGANASHLLLLDEPISEYAILRLAASTKAGSYRWQAHTAARQREPASNFSQNRLIKRSKPSGGRTASRSPSPQDVICGAVMHPAHGQNPPDIANRCTFGQNGALLAK